MFPGRLNEEQIKTLAIKIQSLPDDEAHSQLQTVSPHENIKLSSKTKEVFQLLAVKAFDKSYEKFKVSDLVVFLFTFSSKPTGK